MHATRLESALLATAMTFLAASQGLADISDYEFQLTSPELNKGDSAAIEVRLVNKRTGDLTPDAIIFAKRIDMAPDRMATMDSPIEQISSDKPGHYRFKTNLAMSGRWQLSLGAKVQGEFGTVQSRLVLRAVE